MDGAGQSQVFSNGAANPAFGVNPTAQINAPSMEATTAASTMSGIEEQIIRLEHFLNTAPNTFLPNDTIKRFALANNETIACAFWKGSFFISGTDIVKILNYRFQLVGKPIPNQKKFEEGIFSDLRSLKPGVDSVLEDARSEFLEMLYKNGCVRTQKKQKVFFWYSVPHERLFQDALERDRKRENLINPGVLQAAAAIPSVSLCQINPHGFNQHLAQTNQHLAASMQASHSTTPYQQMLHTFANDPYTKSSDYYAPVGTVDPLNLVTMQQSAPEELSIVFDDPSFQELFDNVIDNSVHFTSNDLTAL